MKKYLVYITYYSGTKLPPFYIGSSYEEKVLNGYNGSVASKKYKETYYLEQKENKHLFKTRILSYHKSYSEALTEELRLQKMHLVVKNKKYFNESYAQVNGSHGRDISGELHPMYGKNHSGDSIKKMLASKLEKDGNGLNSYDRAHIKKSKIDENGNNMYKKASLAATKKLEEIDEEGISGFERASLKMVNKRKTKNKDGLDSYEIGAKKTKETKLLEDKDGLNIYEKAGKKMSGSNNYQTSKILIFNDNDELKYSCSGNFGRFCIENGIPSSIRSTYQNNTKLYQTNKSKAQAIKNGNEDFIGWYAIKENNDN